MIGKVMSGLIGKGKLVVAGAVILAVAALAIGNVIQYRTADRMKADLATAAANVETARAAARDAESATRLLQIRRAEDQGRLDALQHRLNEVQAGRDAAVNELRAWQDRLAAETLARPEVVERAARKAINRTADRACRITGGCDE